MKSPTFTALGGTLGIDFINTMQHHRSRTVNLLNTPDAVVRWLAFMRHTGRLHAASWETLAPGPWPTEGLIRFRRDVRLFLDGGMPRDQFLAMLAQAVAAAPLAFQAVDNAERTQLVAIPTIPGSPGLLSLLAFDWLDLVVSGAVDAVSRCQNGPCLAYFLDPRGRRKWCSMDTCGNRQKNARYYAKANRIDVDGLVRGGNDAETPRVKAAR